MLHLRIFLPILALLGFCAPAAAATDSLPTAFSMHIAALDPGNDATLGTGDRLYVRIRYTSPVSVRFLPELLRQGNVQKSAETSSAPPYDAGRGEALAWLTLASPERTDALRVTAFDLAWQELGSVTTEVVVTWESQDHFEAREPAPWVGPLVRQHRRVFDTAYDPQPEKPEPFFDFFFLISFIAIPLYLLMQAQMLFRYRGRWQWYAAAPLLPFIPLGLYSLLGLGLNPAQWIKLLFHYMAVALLYLLLLWTVKWNREKPLRRARQPAMDTSAGTE